MEDALTTCTYDGTDCYMVKSLAVVDSFEYSTGYTTGGQYLTFWGMRLTGEDDTIVTIDGVDCSIIDDKTHKEEGTCLTGFAGSTGVSGTYVGSNGLRRDRYLSTSAITVSDIAGTATLDETELLMSFEYPNYTPDDGYYEASITSGWIVPPADNNYKFHVTCDDKCTLYLS